MLRLSLAVSIFLLSLLAIFKAPLYSLWLPALVVTEGGTYLAIACGIWVLTAKASNAAEAAARCLILLAALLFLTPLARAISIASALPSSFENTFGVKLPRARDQAPARLKPLSLLDLFRGLRTPNVHKTTVVYSNAHGHSLHMDFYSPWVDNKNLPAVLVVHGGSWRSGDRDEFSGFDRYLAARGYCVASIDYRLVPEGVFPAPRDDVFSAIDYLKAHASDIGWDGKNVVLLGRSAGGQIALSAAYASRYPMIRGVIAFYTPNDLVFSYEHPGNPRILNSKALIQSYLGVPLDLKSRVLYEEASPLNFVNPSTPPTLMIHGGRDELVSPIHEERLSQKLQEARRPYFYLKLPWATHGCDIFLNGPSGQLSIYVVERFLVAVMPFSKGSN